jgi:hypothetical protein
MYRRLLECLSVVPAAYKDYSGFKAIAKKVEAAVDEREENVTPAEESPPARGKGRSTSRGRGKKSKIEEESIEETKDESGDDVPRRGSRKPASA